MAAEEPLESLGKRDNSCATACLGLVHYAEHAESFHFIACSWRGALEQPLNLRRFQFPAFFDQVSEKFGAGKRSGIEGDFQDRPEIVLCYLPPVTQQRVTAS